MYDFAFELNTKVVEFVFSFPTSPETQKSDEDTIWYDFLKFRVMRGKIVIWQLGW